MVCMWFQEWEDERLCCPWARIENFFNCIPMHMMGFAKDAQLLRMSFQMGLIELAGLKILNPCSQMHGHPSFHS